VTAREHEGGGYNRVFGPDFQWRPGEGDAVTGQLLWSDTLTPASAKACAIQAHVIPPPITATSA